MIDFIHQTPETDLGKPGFSKLAREIRVKAQSSILGGSLDAVSGWTTNAVIPASKGAFAYGHLNGKIYVFGGGSAYTVYTNTVYVYTIATNSWAELTAAPVTLGLGTATLLNGKFYVLSNPGSSASTFYEFDPSTGANGTWTAKATPPDVYRHAAVTDGTYVYIIGGYGGGAPVNTVKRYDPVANSWATMAVLPSTKYSHSAEYYNGAIYVFGGIGAGALPTNATAIYTIATDTWTVPTTVVPAALNAMMSVLAGSSIYLFGGGTAGDGTGWVATVYKYNIATATMTTDTVVLPTAATWGGAIYDGSAIFVVGGFNAPTRTISIPVIASTVTVGYVELYCNRVLKFTGTLTTDGTANYKINRFRLPPSCRGESFYMKLYSAAGITMQAYDARITESMILPSGAVK